MDMQNVSNLQIPEGAVRTIHDKDNRLIWGRLAYDTKYAGDTTQNGTPTPDTPIPVQTVTGEQTVTISDGISSQNYLISLTGKNLFDKDNYNLLEAYWGGTSTEMIAYPGGTVSVYIKAKPNTTYTASKTLGTRFRLATTVDLPQANTAITNKIVGDSAASLTITTGPSDQYLSAFVRQGSESATLTEVLATLQIEEGQTATTYVPYYNYELCKIGNYQDYIYKSGDDWYVHKECSKYTFTGSETGQIYSPTSTYTEARFYGNYGEIGPTSNKTTISTKFAYLNNNRVAVISGYNSNNWYVRIPSSFNVTTLEEMRAYVTNNTTYYPLATPTDTKITDATLIGQLNAVHEWLTRYGYNATVTGNLPIIIDRTNL